MIQVNGKLRDRIVVPVSVTEAITEAELPQWALDRSKRLQAYLEGKKIVKTIYVPGRVINVVVR